MNSGQIVCSIIFLILAIGAFIISYLQFREKGYLFNNAYFWATREERQRMDENKESKKPHYRQSGFAFIFIGISILTFAAYIATSWIWMYIAFWMFIIITIVYAIISSIKIEQHK